MSEAIKALEALRRVAQGEATAYGSVVLLPADIAHLCQMAIAEIRAAPQAEPVRWRVERQPDDGFVVVVGPHRAGLYAAGGTNPGHTLNALLAGRESLTLEVRVVEDE